MVIDLPYMEHIGYAQNHQKTNYLLTKHIMKYRHMTINGIPLHIIMIETRILAIFLASWASLHSRSTFNATPHANQQGFWSLLI